MTVTARIQQLAFSGGEWSSARRGRIDLAKYPMSLEYMIGFIPGIGGDAERAPGFGFIAAAKDDTNAPRLLPVVYNDVQSYMLELGEEYIRFFMLGGQIKTVSPDEIYEIPSPWAAEDVWRLQHAQRSDTTFIAGGARDYPPQLLQRVKHASWTLNGWQSNTGPFLDPNDSAITLLPSGVTGSITLTASASLFEPEHATNGGALFRLDEFNTNGYSMWEPAKTYANGDLVRFGPNVYQAVHGTTKTSGAVAPVHTQGRRFDGQATGTTNCEWEYLHSGYGVVRITAVASATSATATVLSRLPSTSAVTTWREGAFSDVRGWPVAVGFAGNRLWWLGTRTQPRSAWGSVGGDPFDFTPGPLDDDAVTLTLESIESNPIRSAAEQGGILYALTSQRVYRISGPNDAPIRPADPVARAVSGEGSSGLQPVNVGRAILFPGSSGMQMFELSFAVEADTDAARDLTVLADHILEPGQ
jgi:hypothetical protein